MSHSQHTISAVCLKGYPGMVCSDTTEVVSTKDEMQAVVEILVLKGMHAFRTLHPPHQPVSHPSYVSSPCKVPPPYHFICFCRWSIPYQRTPLMFILVLWLH